MLADEAGNPQTIRNAICMHEEDYGILWKHWNFRYADQAEVRRSRRFVVSAIHTIGNYEYGFFWYFYLDGTVTLTQNERGADYGITVAPSTWDAVLEGVTSVYLCYHPDLAFPYFHAHFFAGVVHRHALDRQHPGAVLCKWLFSRALRWKRQDD